MRRSDLIFFLVLIATVAGVAGALWFGEKRGEQARQDATLEAADAPAIGGAFTLTDQNGAPVTDADLLGRWTVIYFGYTFCPDVCPVTLNRIAEAIDSLGAKGDKVVPMFITVDPKRDTVEALREYAEHFPGVRFLTGTDEQVQQVLQAYRVYRRFNQETPDDSNYLVDHTSITYVMGPDGKYAAHFTHATPVEVMAERLRRLL